MIAGLAVLAAAWFAPPAGVQHAFADHMLRHVAVVAIATLALALALPGRGATAAPLFAALFEFAVVWGWHLPAAHVWAQVSTAGAIAEQASFLAAGFMVWRTAFSRGGGLAGAGGLLLTSMHMTLLGALLILAPRTLYPAAICGSLADQQIGGMIMLAVGTPVYLIAGLWLTARALREQEAAA